MAQIEHFDADTVAPQGDFEPIPAGDYVFIVKDSEVRETKDGDGEYVRLTLEVVEEGDYKGRQVWTNLNLKNANPTAVQIAKGQLSALCRAVGVTQLSDTNQLHSIPFKARVKVRPARVDKATGQEYPASNEIAKYHWKAEVKVALGKDDDVVPF